RRPAPSTVRVVASRSGVPPSDLARPADVPLTVRLGADAHATALRSTPAPAVPAADVHEKTMILPRRAVQPAPATTSANPPSHAPAKPAIHAPVNLAAHAAARASAAPVAPVAHTPPPGKTMRTLEEVRADLTRLREKSRQQQVRIQEQSARENGFAPTDFMSFPLSMPAALDTTRTGYPKSAPADPAIAAKTNELALRRQQRQQAPVQAPVQDQGYEKTVFVGRPARPAASAASASAEQAGRAERAEQSERAFAPTTYASFESLTDERRDSRGDDFQSTVFA
ncbi:MAG: hypothetical protein KKC79_10545, partial [Gammaproteobacteria bacterium]|nr:hypothetical protein [Gammaproteobacteria bacterium]